MTEKLNFRRGNKIKMHLEDDKYIIIYCLGNYDDGSFNGIVIECNDNYHQIGEYESDWIRGTYKLTQHTEPITVTF